MDGTLPKKEQNLQALLDQIREAGEAIMAIQTVKVDPKTLHRPKLGKVAICPGCREACPIRDGKRCRACRGESPYLSLILKQTA
jgi:hypothetical protein